MTSARVDVPRADFRELMARFPTGVAVVTTYDRDGQPRGMTCSSLCSVTLEPPTLLVCLRDGSPTLDSIRQRDRFAVNLLHEGARSTAELFASGAPDRFDRVGWQDTGGGGPSLVDDAHSVAHCRVSDTKLVGDHLVVFGEVERLWETGERRPLLYGLRQYAAWPGE